MARFDGSIALAQRLIKKNGQAVIIRRFTDAPVPDPDKPWRTGEPEPSDVTVDAVFLDFGDLGRSGERYMEGLEVQTGDKLVLIAGSGLPAPALRDRLYRNGGGSDDEGWAIVNVRTLDPNGQKVLHQLQVRH